MTCVVVSARLPVQKSKDGTYLAFVGILSPLDPLRTNDKPELYFDYMVNLLGAKELNSKGEDVRRAIKEQQSPCIILEGAAANVRTTHICPQVPSSFSELPVTHFYVHEVYAEYARSCLKGCQHLSNILGCGGSS